MATADLKLIYGGGGSFTPTFFSGALQIASGASGTLLTITPPIGKKVRLTALVMTNAGTSEAGISVTASSGVVANALTLRSAASTVVGDFAVGQVVSGAGVSSIPYIDSVTSITITKETGSTTNPISYSYAFGD